MKTGIRAAVSPHHGSSQAFWHSCLLPASTSNAPVRVFFQQQNLAAHTPVPQGPLTARATRWTWRPAAALAATVGKTPAGGRTSRTNLAKGCDTSTTGGDTEAVSPSDSSCSNHLWHPAHCWTLRGSWRRTVLFLSFLPTAGTPRAPLSAASTPKGGCAEGGTGGIPALWWGEAAGLRLRCCTANESPPQKAAAPLARCFGGIWRRWREK